jgi:hypothetical protein
LLNLFKNKKGSELVEIWVVNLVLVGLVLVIMLIGVSKVSDNSIHFQRAKARDITFTYDISTLAQGKLNLVYNTPSNLTYDVDRKCIVKVIEPVKNIPSLYKCNKYEENTNLKLEDKILFLQKNE